MKLKLIIIGLITVGFFVGAYHLVHEKSELNRTIKQLDDVTAQAVLIIGQSPTLKNVIRAEKFINNRKGPIKEKVENLRRKGRLREKTEDNFQFETAVYANKNKIAEIYDDLVDKAKNDIRSLDDEKEKLLKSRKGLSKKTLEVLEDKAKIIEHNMEILKALESVMKVYQSIFDNKQKEKL